MRYLSLFSGIEAATVAWKPLGWTPYAFAEIEKFPSAVLAHHYGSNMPGEPLSSNGVPNFGDVTKFKEWPDGPIDLICGGSPCQSFSVAGLRKGMDDPRGNLALVYLAIVNKYRPRWVVYENVPGLLSSNGGRDFGSFIGGLAELGYGFAYRVLDAQYVRVDGFGRAVPQRRRRVFVVGYLGDWRRAAAVLLEPQGMRGDSAPSREQGKRVAPTIASRPTGGGGLGTDFDLDGGLITSTGNVAHCLNAGGMGRQDFETETMVAHTLLGKENSSHQADRETYIAFDCKASGQAGFGVGEIAPTLRAMGHLHGNKNAGDQIAVAHTLKGEGFDASEDGTGRGTPIVPVHAIQAGALRENPNSGPDGVGVQEGISYTLEARAEVQAVAFDMRGREGGAQFEGPHDTANIRAASGGSSKSYVAQEWAVRRLTPTECERLQGFPDNFTNVPWGKKDTSPDGPRYKALGNSMAVNVMRWIGRRIEMVEKITKGEAA